ncbi:hypothetical protein EV177_008323, partial [Coemansia sp. RSA 1804]
IGDAFVMLPLEEAQERVEKEMEFIDQHVEDLDSQISDISSQMEDLKKVLYKRFGNSINLERS